MRKGLKFHEVEQNSANWYKLRLGKLTSSRIHTLLVDPKWKYKRDEYQKIVKDENGDKVKEYEDVVSAGTRSLIMELANEIITQETKPDWDNYHTERGKALEPIAINEYSERYWKVIDTVGFIQYGDYAGTSPDAMTLEDEEGHEVKCLSGKEHLTVINYGPDKDHITQCQWHMFITGFKTWNLIYYHPKYRNKDMLVFPIKADKTTHDKFKERYQIVVNEIQRLVALCSEPAKELV